MYVTSKLYDAKISCPSLLAHGERGAIFPTIIERLAPNAIQGVRGPLLQDCRRALLFFDRLDAPSNNVLTMVPEDPDNMVSSGIMINSRQVFEGQIDRAPIEYTPFAVFEARDRQEPGAWALWEEGGYTCIPDWKKDPERGFRLAFQDALLLPHDEVSLDDILLFKKRRRSELISLRHHLEELCIKVSGEGVDLRTVRIEVERFDASLADYNKTMSEANWRKAFGSLEVEVSWSDALKGFKEAIVPAVTATSGAVAAGLSVTSAALFVVGPIAASIGIKSTFGIKGRTSAHPFRYLTSIQRDL